jgi:hypothetical protein
MGQSPHFRQAMERAMTALRVSYPPLAERLEHEATLTGSLPLRPFGSKPYGITKIADGQEARVAALVCDVEGQVIFLSLVGSDNTLAATTALLFLGEREKAVKFVPDPEVNWRGATTLPRCLGSANRFTASLLGTREKNYLVLAQAANIQQGLLFPLPPPEDPKPDQETEQRSPVTIKQEKQEAAAPPVPRFVLGNNWEASPPRDVFLGHLRVLRVTYAQEWADLLWVMGLARKLVVPVASALGVACWRMDSDLRRWEQFLSEGLHEGWLPDPEEA